MYLPVLLIMWMLYDAEFYPKPENLECCIHRIYSKLTSLQMDAEHELVYNFNVFCDEEETQRVKELAINYSEGMEICNLYLSRTICIECFCHEISKLNLQRFLFELKPFLPVDLVAKFCPSASSYGTEEEEEGATQGTLKS